MAASKKIRSLIQFVVLFGIGLLLVWLSLRQVAPEKDNIIKAFQKANYFWVFVSLGIAWFSHFLRAYRWNYLLEPAGHKTKLLNAVCHVFIGYLTNYGIPRMGEISRCTMAAKYDKVPFEIGFGTVITERIVDTIIFLLFFLFTLMLQFAELSGLANELIFDKIRNLFHKLAQDNGKLILFTLILVAGTVLFLMFRKRFAKLFKGKFGGMIKGMLEGIGSIRKLEHPVRFILLSVLIWLSYFYALYTCFFALSGTEHLTQGQGLTLMLFGTFGVIFSPGGLGAYPLILYGILVNTYHVDTVSAFALPWLAWTSQFILILILGVISFIILPIYNSKKDVSPIVEG